MKKIVFLTNIFVVLISLFLCVHSCVSQNKYLSTDDDIIGKWKLVKTVYGRTAQDKVTHTYSTVEVIFEFNLGNILTIHCLLQDDNCDIWKTGKYSYRFYIRNEGNQRMIEIDSYSHYWFSISENEIILSGTPVDRPSYYFERIY